MIPSGKIADHSTANCFLQLPYMLQSKGIFTVRFFAFINMQINEALWDRHVCSRVQSLHHSAEQDQIKLGSSLGSEDPEVTLPYNTRYLMATGITDLSSSYFLPSITSFSASSPAKTHDAYHLPGARRHLISKS